MQFNPDTTPLSPSPSLSPTSCNLLPRGFLSTSSNNCTRRLLAPGEGEQWVMQSEHALLFCANELTKEDAFISDDTMENAYYTQEDLQSVLEVLEARHASPGRQLPLWLA